MRDAVFYLGLGAFFTHELDAMPNHEWRVLPVIRALPDDVGMAVFVALHLPLFAGVIALVASNNEGVRRVSRLVVAGFLVVHALLHVLFSGHPDYEFSTRLSELLIFGGAGLGAGYLALELRDRRTLADG